MDRDLGWHDGDDAVEASERRIAASELEVRFEDRQRDVDAELAADATELPCVEEAHAAAYADREDEEPRANAAADVASRRLGVDEAGREILLVDIERVKTDVLEAADRLEPEPRRAALFFLFRRRLGLAVDARIVRWRRRFRGGFRLRRRRGFRVGRRRRRRRSVGRRPCRRVGRRRRRCLVGLREGRSRDTQGERRSEHRSAVSHPRNVSSFDHRANGFGPNEATCHSSDG